MIAISYWSDSNDNALSLVEHLSYLGTMYLSNREKYYKESPTMN